MAADDDPSFKSLRLWQVELICVKMEVEGGCLCDWCASKHMKVGLGEEKKEELFLSKDSRLLSV